VDEEIGTDCKYLLEVTEFEVSVKAVFYHLTDFRVGYLPDAPPSMFDQVNVVVKRAEEVIHVFEMTW
jgi:hypothetical protein